MDQQQWKQISNIVDTALELSAEERSNYIESKCLGKPQMKREVTELLRAIDQSSAENYLEDLNDYPHHLAWEISKTETGTFTSSLIGTDIGPYKIVDLIGHGGMGSVFLAERADESFTQKVAVKILRRGMDTPSNIARFQRERNILAKMNHQNIARLMDGGMTEDNLPYLVMEYVKGDTLYDYCDKHQLPVEERLDLFKSICEAVQQAHNNAIIHRDLKPSNILVTVNREVKILDFGIAKLLEPENPDTELYQTRTGAHILTPAYAAPEQLSHRSITTKTDIYTLGTLLYELLAGASPFDTATKNISEIENQIRKEDPPEPAARFDELESRRRKKLALHRKLSAKSLKSKLRGDTSAIILKALRKNPKERYDTVNQLLEDLERLDNHLPLIAKEDTFRYNTSKFIKRHKTALSIATGFLVLITAFVFFYTWQINQERKRAQLEAQKARKVSSFLTSLFRMGNPAHHPANTITATTLLERGRNRLKSLNNQPEVQAQLSSVIGSAYLELGRYNQAKPLIKQSQKLRKNFSGTSSPEYAEALKNHGILQRKMGNYAKAESLQQEGQAIYQSAPQTSHLIMASSLNELGWTVYKNGDYKRADSLYIKALQHIEKSPEPAEEKRANILVNRSSVLRKMEKLEKAERLAKKGLSLRRKVFGDIHPDVAVAYNDLGLILDNQEKHEQADSLYHRGLNISKRLYNKPHPDITTTLYNIGTLYREQKKYNKAQNYLSKTLDMEQQLLGKNHPSVAITLSQLASIAREMEKFEKAVKLSRRELSIRKQNLNNTHPGIARAYHDLGLIMQEWGKANRADSLYHKSLEIEKQLYQAPHRSIASTLSNLGNLHMKVENYKKAESYLLRAFRMNRKVFDITHPEITETLDELARLYQKIGKEGSNLISLLEDALQIKGQTPKENKWQEAYSDILQGKALLAIDKYKYSEQLLIQGYRTLKKEQNPPENYRQKALGYMAELYKQWDKPTLYQKYRAAIE